MALADLLALPESAVDVADADGAQAQEGRDWDARAVHLPAAAAG
ncbi:hypothetical protein GCM10010508_51430 [Streptomyces naganishii JCM 4654]|uniref:Uncharacterized protein n=1 Tax=Streptomyces naganishii JCM 4654 TaxID=1306179 RepID=A0A919CX91_9ACTN|nr:hypothetical protein GCM10010508_51430 [Streptomyces naganishii JCM 4654]